MSMQIDMAGQALSEKPEEARDRYVAVPDRRQGVGRAAGG